MSLKTRELHGTSGGGKDLRITAQQKSVEAMLRLGFIRSVKITQGKVIHTSTTELTAFYFWSGEFSTRLNLRSEVLSLYERGDLGESGFRDADYDSAITQRLSESAVSSSEG